MAVKPRHSLLRQYSFAWVTLALFLIALIGHWIFGWSTYVNEQETAGLPVEVSAYVNEMMRDTLENWQSEFLQLLWQVAGLAFLLYVGSPQSKEGDDRVEAKIDEILLRVAPKEAQALLDEIDDEYAGRHTDPRHVRNKAKPHHPAKGGRRPGKPGDDR